MMSFMLRSLNEFFAEPLSIVSIVCLSVSFALICSAKNITRAIRKTKDIKSNDKAFIITILIGVILLIAGLVLMVLTCGSMVSEKA